MEVLGFSEVLEPEAKGGTFDRVGGIWWSPIFYYHQLQNMGIKNLMKLLSEEVNGCVKEVSMANLNGRAIAIDASMALYQFLIAVRSGDGSANAQLTNEAGEVTSHIQGMFNRTIRLMENGIKPVYVFDGKPPVMKSGELAKRKMRRELAKENLKVAEEEGNEEDIEKFNKRLTRVTPEHNEDCKKLLELMGVPVITAPCEAEATCAALAKSGKVFAAGTEDMDTMTFGTPVLLRRLTMAASRKLPILEIRLEKALEGLELSMDEFIDFCILCGCDYCDSIRGVGPKKALAAIKEYKSIERFLEALKEKMPKGVTVPEEWNRDVDPIYQQARVMFSNAEVLDCKDVKLEWTGPQEEALTHFLVNEKGFGAERVKTAIAKLKKAKSTHSQQRMESFFKVLPSKVVDNKKRKGKDTSVNKKKKLK